MKIKSAKAIILFTIFLSFAAYIPDAYSEEASAQQDTLLKKRPVMNSRSGWEKAAYAPGHLVYLPLKYTLRSLNYTVGYIDEKKIVQKINDFLTSDDGRIGVMPTYESRTGAGARFYHKGLFIGGKEQNKFEAIATAGDFWRQRYEMSLENVRILHFNLYSNFLAGYTNLTSEEFYGLGPESEYDSNITYAIESSEFQFTLSKPVSLNSRMNVLFGVNSYRVYPTHDNSLFNLLYSECGETVWGLTDKVGLFNISADYTYDSKNRPGNPTMGTEAVAFAGIYPEASDFNRYGFYKYSVDLTKIFNLFYERILVLRLASENIEPLNDKFVPMYMLSELGEKETIRGFSRGRYRDMDKLLMTAEYRYPLWRFWMEYGLDMSLFIDTGQVAPDIYKDAALRDFAVGYGFGFRLWDEEGLIGKLEIGFSKDEYRIYAVLN